MFRNLAQLLAATAGRQRNDVFLVHPLQLSRWLDEAWDATRTIPVFGTPTAQKPFLGSTEVVEILNLPKPQVSGGRDIAPSGVVLADPDVYTDAVFPVTSVGLAWDHLIYAYLIESTGVFEVMAEVLRRLLVGETLDTLSSQGLRWVRATEELFFRDPPLFSISGAVSDVRPEDRINRRNVIWRMFCMDLPHPIPPRWAIGPAAVGDQAWKSDLGTGVNTGFREKWTELLRQVWLGAENARNFSGANATDREYVAFLANALKDMMNMRRRGGQLAREEFVHVSTMSWFHLTLESDTPIVSDLRADATSPADRLAKIAQRVGMQPAARSRELFELADLMSALLRAIELGAFDTGATAETLYVPLAGNVNAQLLQDMNRVIDLWQSATGDRVKERPSAGVAGTLSAQPLRIPTPGPTNLQLPSGTLQQVAAQAASANGQAGR
jgi:hypothetical protein